MRDTIPPKRGGARPGSGRKPREVPRVAITVRLEPEVAECFKALCEASGRSQAAMVADLVGGYRKKV